MNHDGSGWHKYLMALTIACISHHGLAEERSNLFNGHDGGVVQCPGFILFEDTSWNS